MRYIALLAATVSSLLAQTTFYKNVLPVLERRCQNCHRPGEAAPMSLLDYRSARPWAKSIKQAVLERKMPPWFADPHFGKFLNDASLTPAEIRTIAAWVDCGAPSGDPRDAPAPAAWVDGWRIGRPDVVFEMPQPVEIPASGTIPYRYVRVPTHFKEDTWVQFAEVRAGDRQHTHHIVASVVEPGVSGDALASQGEFLAGYGPGAVPETFAPGQAKLVKAASDVVFQLHYTTDGKPGRDRSRVGLILAKNPPAQRVLMLAAANLRFWIPPGDPDFVLDARVTLHRPATLVSLLPHMHLRGKSFEFRAVYPDGEREILLRVPHYDFDWQLSYYLDPPKPLPEGTVIECTAHYDNSLNNARNPDPSRGVRFGEQNWDEMMIGYFEVAVERGITAHDLLIAK